MRKLRRNLCTILEVSMGLFDNNNRKDKSEDKMRIRKNLMHKQVARRKLATVLDVPQCCKSVT